MPIKKKSAPEGVKSAPEGAEYAAETTEESAFEAEDAEEQAVMSQSLQGGWGAAKKRLEQSGSGGAKNHFKFTADAQLITFVVGEPIDSYSQHWINNRDGQKSFRCAENGCPICAAGDNPSARFTFRVLCFEEDDAGDIEPVQKLMTVGIKAFKQLAAIDEDAKRGGPLEGHFFSAYRAGEKKDTTHHFTPVKLRDVEEDWELPQEAALDALKEAQAAPAPKVWMDKLETLKEVASEMKKSA